MALPFGQVFQQGPVGHISTNHQEWVPETRGRHKPQLRVSWNSDVSSRQISSRDFSRGVGEE